MRNIVLSLFIYSQNTEADELSRLDTVDTFHPVKKNIKSINEHYGLQDEGITLHTNNKTIMQNQQKDKEFA